MARYYSLKDVAEKVNVPEYTIRYWIRTLGLRGKKRNNRIYFTERDVEYFIGIKSLIEKGYTLTSIKSLIKDEGRSVLLKWAEKELSARIIREIKASIKEINNLILMIKEMQSVH